MTNVRLVDEQVMMNNHGSPVKARGDLEILIDGNKINLYDVAYIPESAHNIISVSHILDREGGAVRYTKNTITLLREGKRPVKGFRRGGLYFFSDALCGGVKKTPSARRTALATEDKETKDFCFNKGWAVDYMQKMHSRLHVGGRALRAVLRRDQKELRLSNAQMSWLMQVTKAEMMCDSCERAKVRKKHPKQQQRRRQRRKGAEVQEQREGQEVVPNGLVADTAGPNRRSLQGNKYVFVVVDKDSLSSYLLFGKSKSDAAPEIEENLPVWLEEMKSKPTSLQTDIGGEFMDQVFLQFLKERGIRHKHTARDSSCDIAEKRIDTLQTISRAQMNWAQCPEYMWQESHKYANTVISFVPSASDRLKGLSPWEKKKGVKPKTHLLQPFGCVAYAHIPKAHRNRQGGPVNRGRKCMFVGLSAEGENDGYRLYDPETKSFFHVKGDGNNGVTFDVHTPFWSEREKGEEIRIEMPDDPVQSPRVPVVPEKVAPVEALRIPVQAPEEGEKVAEVGAPIDIANPADDGVFVPVMDGAFGEEEHVLLPEERDRRSQRPRAQAGIFDPTAWEEQFKRDREANIAIGERMIVGAKKRTKKQPKMKKRFIWKRKRGYGADNPLPSGEIPMDQQEALTGKDKARWREAMFGAGSERESHQKAGTMRQIARSKVPRGRKLIKARWVFDLKKNSEGVVVKFKARLVAKGFLQVAGRDYGETFAPTPALASLRLVISLALPLGFKVHHMDVSTAFLIPDLPEDQRVYLEPPPGLELDDDKCYELMKCIYGLKQSANKWNEHVDAMLRRHGFDDVPGERCVYTHKSRTGKIDCILAVHVDDIIIASTEKKLIRVKEIFNKSYTMKDLGELQWGQEP
ncbi:MAG: reverse transcriptase domain-containing protein, partial [Flavobacteriales bacterium]|nr:reverse transcriptase domain-containing protein [Flavobacteriales bacterium]